MTIVCLVTGPSLGIEGGGGAARAEGPAADLGAALTEPESGVAE